MTIQQMIEAIQDKIADKTLSRGCKVIIVPQDEYGDDVEYIMSRGDERPLDQIGKIVGHPISLAGILSALGDWYRYQGGELLNLYGTVICPRKLLNENGSDVMFDSQSEETIEAIYNIICK